MEAPREKPSDVSSAPILQVEAEGRESRGVRGEPLEAPLYDETLDKEERKVPDDEGDEKPRDAWGKARQAGDPLFQGEDRPPEDRRQGDEEGELRRAEGRDPQQEGEDDRGTGPGQPREDRQSLDDADRRRLPPFDPVGVRLVAEPQVRQEEQRGQDEVAGPHSPERKPRLAGPVKNDPDDAGVDRGDDGQPDIAAAPPRRRRPRIPANQGGRDRGDLGAQKEEDGGQRPEEDRLQKGHGRVVTRRPPSGRAPRLPPSRRGSGARRFRPSLRSAAPAPAGCWRPGPAPPRRRRGRGSRRRRSPPAPAASRSAPPLPPPGT